MTVDDLTPHRYRTLGHMCHPDDFVPCCEHSARDPLHDVPEPRTCDCNRLTFVHLHGRGCP